MRMFVNDKGILRETEAKSLPPVDILVGAPHKDDEMFPAGRLINRRNCGYSVGFFVATDGAGSNYRGVQGQELVDLRTEESRLAVQNLGGLFLVCYENTSKLLKSKEGFEQMVGNIEALLRDVRPKELYLTGPTDRHPTHLITTEAGIQAARANYTNAMPDTVRLSTIFGYEVWTPMLALAAPQLLDKLVFKEDLSEQTALRKHDLQKGYESQNVANPYHIATQTRNIGNRIMLDAHSSGAVGSTELFLDMAPLVEDKNLRELTVVEYGGGLAGLAQYLVANPTVVPDRQTLLGLVSIWAKQYREAAATSTMLMDCIQRTGQH